MYHRHTTGNRNQSRRARKYVGMYINCDRNCTRSLSICSDLDNDKIYQIESSVFRSGLSLLHTDKRLEIKDNIVSLKLT